MLETQEQFGNSLCKFYIYVELFAVTNSGKLSSLCGTAQVVNHLFRVWNDVESSLKGRK